MLPSTPVFYLPSDWLTTAQTLKREANPTPGILAPTWATYKWITTISVAGRAHLAVAVLIWAWHATSHWRPRRLVFQPKSQYFPKHLIKNKEKGPGLETYTCTQFHRPLDTHNEPVYSRWKVTIYEIRRLGRVIILRDTRIFDTASQNIGGHKEIWIQCNDTLIDFKYF